jgi:hypothetical protein
MLDCAVLCAARLATEGKDSAAAIEFAADSAVALLTVRVANVCENARRAWCH